MLNTRNVLMFVVLSAGMLTALTATMMSQAVPVYADKKKCEDNKSNNCNDKHKTQKIDQKNKCDVENENSHHSKKNDNTNDLFCLNDAANLNDIFASITDGLVSTTASLNNSTNNS